ncbi:MAG: hypothetical protein JWP27_1800 [Flaviaesturariibacter sp.]|nr:hypothetical protein [Flaviaesturariibacter sp.]
MAQANDNNKQDQQGRNEETHPMSSKRDVEQSPDEKTDQDFPGYPHYPAKEDIMDQRTDSHRVDLDVENLPNSRNMTGVSQRYTGTGEEARPTGTHREQQQPNETYVENDPELNPRTNVGSGQLAATDSEDDEIGTPQNVDDDDLGMRPGTEGDVSDEERRALQDSTFMPTSDETNLRSARLDDTDFDGDRLNEESFGERRTGVGLDIPDETDETQTESMGQGDEENKYFSLGGDRHEGNEEDPYSGPGRGDA